MGNKATTVPNQNNLSPLNPISGYYPGYWAPNPVQQQVGPAPTPVQPILPPLPASQPFYPSFPPQPVGYGPQIINRGSPYDFPLPLPPLPPNSKVINERPIPLSHRYF